MVQVNKRPNELSPFQRGFLPTGLRAPVRIGHPGRCKTVQNRKEGINLAPLKFQLVDPQNTRSNCGGWHSCDRLNRRVSFSLGYPCCYQCKALAAALSRQTCGSLANELTQRLGADWRVCCISAVIIHPRNACQSRPIALRLLTSQPLIRDLHPVLVFLPRDGGSG